MITRVLRGWTTAGNADAYQQLLLTTVFPRIAARDIKGYLGIRLDRRRNGDEVEFVTTMLFGTHDAVVAFAGADYETSVVPDAARAVLLRFDERATHYDRVAGMGTFTPPALVLPQTAYR